MVFWFRQPLMWRGTGVTIRIRQACGDAWPSNWMKWYSKSLVFVEFKKNPHIGVCFSIPWTHFWCHFDPMRSPLISIPQFYLIFSSFGYLLVFLALRNQFWAQGQATWVKFTLIWGRNGIPNAVCTSQFLGEIWHHLSPLSLLVPAIIVGLSPWTLVIGGTSGDVRICISTL